MTEWHNTPKDILTVIQQAEAAVSKLKEMSRRAGMERNFTLDGRLVGDIGELLVARYYRIVRDEKPKGYAHDLYANINGVKRGVQVKLRRQGGGNIEFKWRPDVLIVLEIKTDWSQWREVYHGDGAVVVVKGLTVDEDRHLRLGDNRTSTEFTLEQIRQKVKANDFCKLTPSIEQE